MRLFKARSKKLFKRETSGTLLALMLISMLVFHSIYAVEATASIPWVIKPEVSEPGDNPLVYSPPTPVAGKGIWIWRLSGAEGGNVSAIIEKCKKAGIKWVAIKCGDGTDFWSEQCTPSLITRFHNAGIKFLGWQYVYGDDPIGEAGVADEILGTAVDGFIVDAESEYEGKPDSAVVYLEEIRGAHPDSFVAYTTFPIIDYHKDFPYIEFGRYSDAVMLQAYWKEIGVSPEEMIDWMEEQWNKWHKIWKEGGYGDSIKPIIPIGQGWNVSESEITTFCNLVYRHGYDGISLWRYGTMTEENWEAYTKCFPPTIIVPDDYPTVQAAINAADHGDTVYVRAGTYYENVVVNKTISLFGENKETTIIDGKGVGNVVYLISSGVIVDGFMVQNSGSEWPDAHGIYLWFSSGSKLSGNVLTKTSYGIGLYFSHENTLSSNTITNNTGSGIHLWNSSGNILSDNMLKNNENSGISFGDLCSGNTLSSNNITNSYWGIQHYMSSSNTFSGNIIRDSWYGIDLMSGSSDSTLSNNTIANNEFGIILYGASGNFICHNNFVNNTSQVISYLCTNIWDDGYPSSGNYWSDYSDVDRCCGPDQDIPGKDGIWDHPYVIDENNTDNYPLVKPYKLGNLSVSIYTDKHSYHAGETIHLGLEVTNPDSVKYVCFAVWVELPDNSTYLYMHQHSVVLPIGLEYSNPTFDSIILPSLPTGNYTWHAAFLERATHTIIVEDTAEWKFL
jgi:parallel beta-helix repeat protein